MKRPMVEIAREVCGSVRVGGKNPKSMWWNYKDETTVRRKDVVWKEMLAVAIKSQRKIYREEKG